MSVLICPACQYENVVVSCGFCLQCGIDLDGRQLSPQTVQPEAAAPNAETDCVAALAAALAEQLSATVVDAKGTWAVRLATTDGRHQVVHLVPGEQATTLLSICGPAIEQNAMPLLVWNSQLRQTSFAARKINGRMMFVATSHHVPDAADLAATVAAVQSLAQLADRVEAKISAGADHH